MQAVKRFCFCNVYSRSELISTWKTFHWGTSGGAGTGEWIEKSAKFKINDINYREFVEKRETSMLSIVCCTRWKFAKGVYVSVAQWLFREIDFC